MFKTFLFAGALGALLLTSTAACVEPEPALDEATDELTGFCILGEICRDFCVFDENGERSCTEFCSLDIGPCESGGGGDGGGGGDDDCEKDDDNPPDICPGGGGSRFP